jgi:subtilisin family serine protease
MAPFARPAALTSIVAVILASITLPANAGAPEGTGLLDRLALPTPPQTVSVMLELEAEPAAIAWANSPSPRSARVTAQAAIARVERMASGVRRAVGSENVIFESTNVYAGVAVRASKDDLDSLADIPGVKAVHRMVPKERDNFVAIPLVSAPAAWTGAAGTGEGVTIGIIDSGIDYTHAAFGGPGTVAAYQAAADAKVAGQDPVYPDPLKVAGGYDFAGYDYDPSDPARSTPTPDDNPLDCKENGHGTHVAATAGGYGVAADGSTYPGPWDEATPFDSMGIAPGVAPEATLYALKVFGCTGPTEVVIPALDWAMDPNGDGDFSDHLDVVNMSLGSSYGSDQDPDSVATNNAVDAGIAVIASAGNEGDTYEISGSPGNAVKALSVASSEDNGQITDGFRATIGGSESTYANLRAQDYDWTSGAGASGQVVQVGDWDAPLGSGNNADGCDEFTAEDASDVSGRIVLLLWDANDVTRRCGSAVRTDHAADAGAIGAILGGSQVTFSAGIAGSSRIPAILTLGSTTEALHQALNASTAVSAILDNSLTNSERIIVTGPEDPTDMASDFTSRGTALAGNVKPDVSAPGGTIFSAAVGTGDQGISFSGTSMAAPVTAGIAALVLAAHPSWTPEQVKAAIMNTADHDLYLGPARTGPRYDNLRMGSGRVDALGAVSTDAVAYVVDDPGAVSVSFGVMNVASSTSRSKQVRVKDLRTSGGARSYDIRLKTVHSLPGATYTVSPTSVRLEPGMSAKVRVTISVNPSRLVHKADPTISLDPLQDGTMREFLADASSLLLVTPSGGSPLRVPVFAAPRPASTLAAPGKVTVGGSGTQLTGSLKLSGTGVDVTGSEGYERQRSRISALQLLAESPQLPYCTPGISTGCVTTRDEASADLRYVGFTSDAQVIKSREQDPLSAETPGRAYFGVASWQPWRSAASIIRFTFYLDTNNDGTPDLLFFNVDEGQDVFKAVAISVRPEDLFSVVSMELINNVAGNKDTAKLHGNVMTLPLNLASLANPVDMGGNPVVPFITADTTSISYWVEAYGPGEVLIDAVGHPRVPLRSNPLSPALTAFTSNGAVPANAQRGTRLTVTMDPTSAGTNPRLLLMHHLNTASKRAQIVKVVR